MVNTANLDDFSCVKVNKLDSEQKEKVFNFQGFSITQKNAAMKLTTDAVLLGAWTAFNFKYQRVLDIGVGTGILSLILADLNKLSSVDILGIDIELSAVQDATYNFANSRYSKMLRAQHISLDDFLQKASLAFFDLIICNPPYFKKSIDYNNKSRESARCQNVLTKETLFDAVKILLSEKGVFTMIIPFEYANEYIMTAKNRGLLLLKRTDISSKKNKNHYVTLLAFIKVFEKNTAEYSKLFKFSEDYLYEHDGSKSEFWYKLSKNLYLKK